MGGGGIKTVHVWVGDREKETGGERELSKTYAFLSSLFLHWLY